MYLYPCKIRYTVFNIQHCTDKRIAFYWQNTSVHLFLIWTPPLQLVLTGTFKATASTVTYVPRSKTNCGLISNLHSHFSSLPWWHHHYCTIMADRKYSNGPSPSMSSPSHQNGQIGETVPQSSPLPHQNGVVDQFEGAQSSGTGSPVLQHLRSSSRTSDPPSHFRALGDFVTSVREAAFPRPRGQSLGSSLSSRMRTAARARVTLVKLSFELLLFNTVDWLLLLLLQRRGSQQEEPEALLDLILESQGQRLNDQRASLSLLPDPGAAALCETCNLNQPHAPTMDFYYMLIDYQVVTCPTYRLCFLMNTSYIRVPHVLSTHPLT